MRGQRLGLVGYPLKLRHIMCSVNIHWSNQQPSIPSRLCLPYYAPFHTVLLAPRILHSPKMCSISLFSLRTFCMRCYLYQKHIQLTR